jgi:hypothetical protein
LRVSDLGKANAYMFTDWIGVKCDKFKDELQHAHQLLELITPGSGHQSLLESLSVAVQATDAINEELSSKQSLKVS